MQAAASRSSMVLPRGSPASAIGVRQQNGRAHKLKGFSTSCTHTYSAFVPQSGALQSLIGHANGTRPNTLSPTCPASNCILRHASALGRGYLELRAWRHALYCSSKLRSGTKWRSWTEGSRHEPLAKPTPGTNRNDIHCLQARSRAHLARSHVICCDSRK